MAIDLHAEAPVRNPEEEILAPGITGHFYGTMPVQGEGHIDGFPWYFRARWDSWTLQIAREKDGDPVDDNPSITWSAGGAYHNASFMRFDEARGLVIEAATTWRELLGVNQGPDNV